MTQINPRPAESLEKSGPKVSRRCLEANLSEVAAAYLVATGELELLKNELAAYRASVSRYQRVINQLGSDPEKVVDVRRANKRHQPIEPIKPYLNTLHVH